METIIACSPFLLAYLIGTIPSGLICKKWAGLKDRKLIVATSFLNFLKAYIPLMIFSFIAIDLIEIPAVWPNRITLEDGSTQPVFGEWFLIMTFPLLTMALMLGDMFPIWLKFRGERGVTCLFGIFFAYSWMLGVIAVAVWLLIFISVRYSSLAALIAMPFAPIVLEWIIPYVEYGSWNVTPSIERFGYMISALSFALPIPIILMVLKHLPNIRRLLHRKEPRTRFLLSQE